MKIRALCVSFILGLFVAAGIQAQTASKTYVDSKNGFSISYPNDFALATGAGAASENYFGDPGTGTKLLKISPISIPEKYHGDYEFNIWKASNAKNCGPSAPGQGDENALPAGWSPTMTIAGSTFYLYASSDAGMSKSMTLIGYRGVLNKRCWQIQSIANQAYAFEDKTVPFSEKILKASFVQFIGSFQLVKK